MATSSIQSMRKLAAVYISVSVKVSQLCPSNLFLLLSPCKESRGVLEPIAAVQLHTESASSFLMSDDAMSAEAQLLQQMVWPYPTSWPF